MEEDDTWGEPSTEAEFASEVLAELSRRLVVGQPAKAVTSDSPDLVPVVDHRTGTVIGHRPRPDSPWQHITIEKIALCGPLLAISFTYDDSRAYVLLGDVARLRAANPLPGAAASTFLLMIDYYFNGHADSVPSTELSTVTVLTPR
ncbi:MAG: hypothetical protein ABI112_10650 [Terracoccus sp.]